MNIKNLPFKDKNASLLWDAGFRPAYALSTTTVVWETFSGIKITRLKESANKKMKLSELVKLVADEAALHTRLRLRRALAQMDNGRGFIDANIYPKVRLV